MPIEFDPQYFDKMANAFIRLSVANGTEIYTVSRDHSPSGLTNDTPKFVHHAKYYINCFKYTLEIPEIEFTSDYKRIMIYEILPMSRLNKIKNSIVQ